MTSFNMRQVQPETLPKNSNFSSCLQNNMKPARPWMLAHLKIIWQFHAHPVHQKVSRFFGPRYIGDNLFLGPNLVSFNLSRVLVTPQIFLFDIKQKNPRDHEYQTTFNRAVVPLLELSFLTKSQKLTSA
jgi:hypothetical protein